MPIDSASIESETRCRHSSQQGERLRTYHVPLTVPDCQKREPFDTCAQIRPLESSSRVTHRFFFSRAVPYSFFLFLFRANVFRWPFPTPSPGPMPMQTLNIRGWRQSSGDARARKCYYPLESSICSYTYIDLVSRIVSGAFLIYRL